MDIKRKFLKLTKKTYPYGTENQLVSHLPHGYFKDVYGNYYFKIGKSKTAFTCHLDTASKSQVVINHRIDKNIISTDGKSILGADDKAGMTILLYMIEKKIPGLYCFFIGEEVGCIGSGKASEEEIFKSYDKMISFDRRGTKSVITHQSSRRCCSEEFANKLSNELNRYGLNMSPDDSGVYTDSAEFTDVIPECTNISVGYYKEHTVMEHQDIEHLIKLCVAVTKINWDDLPTVRNPKDIEYKPYTYKSYGYSTYEKEYSKYENSSWTSFDNWGTNKKTRRSQKKTTYGYGDDFYYDDEYSNCTQKNSSRAYFDNLENDLSDEFYSRNYDDLNYYESLKQQLFEDGFTQEEKKLIKDQFIDPMGACDSDFIDSLMI